MGWLIITPTSETIGSYCLSIAVQILLRLSRSYKKMKRTEERKITGENDDFHSCHSGCLPVLPGGGLLLCIPRQLQSLKNLLRE